MFNVLLDKARKNYMSNHAYVSKVRLVSTKSIIVDLSSSGTISRPLLILSIAPAILSVIGAFVTFHFNLLFLSGFLVLLSVIAGAFFWAVLDVHLQAKHTIKLQPTGVKVVNYTMLGPRSRFFPRDDLDYITAKIDGGDEVLICLILNAKTKETLFSIPVEELDHYIPKITALLEKKYIATVECMSIIAPHADVAKPDVISIDITDKVLRLDFPDSHEVELPFSSVASVVVMGQREGHKLLFSDASRPYEYVCEPLLCMNDGNLYFLQRFTSTEPTLTNSSRAYTSASKTADYLNKIIL